MKIAELLNIRRGITALIGGGGKTALTDRLAAELSAHRTVIVGTSTKIYRPDHFKVLTGACAAAITEALKSDRVICIGETAENGKLSAPAVGFEELKKLADHVIVEADGAHRLPIKAHAGYEPVIPAGTDRTVLVIGADCFGKPIAEICHRPELFAEIAGAKLQSAVTPEIVKRVIEREKLGDCLFINKVENEAASEYARKLAELLDMPVIAGSLRKEEYVCLR